MALSWKNATSEIPRLAILRRLGAIDVADDLEPSICSWACLIRSVEGLQRRNCWFWGAFREPCCWPSAEDKRPLQEPRLKIRTPSSAEVLLRTIMTPIVTTTIKDDHTGPEHIEQLVLRLSVPLQLRRAIMLLGHCSGPASRFYPQQVSRTSKALSINDTVDDRNPA